MGARRGHDLRGRSWPAQGYRSVPLRTETSVEGLLESFVEPLAGKRVTVFRTFEHRGNVRSPLEGRSIVPERALELAGADELPRPRRVGGRARRGRNRGRAVAALAKGAACPRSQGVRDGTLSLRRRRAGPTRAAAPSPVASPVRARASFGPFRRLCRNARVEAFGTRVPGVPIPASLRKRARAAFRRRRLVPALPIATAESARTRAGFRNGSLAEGRRERAPWLSGATASSFAPSSCRSRLGVMRLRSPERKRPRKGAKAQPPCQIVALPFSPRSVPEGRR